MRILWGVLPLFVFIWLLQNKHGNCEKPDVVNVGAVFAFDSVMGRAVKKAMELAVSDINGDPSILNGTSLNLIMEDSECSVFKGSIGGKYFNSSHFGYFKVVTCSDVSGKFLL